MIEYLYAPALVRHGLSATDPNGLPVDVAKGYRFALGDDGSVIGPYNYTRRRNAEGEIEYDPVTPLLETLGEKQKTVGRSVMEVRLAEVSVNSVGTETWAFFNREQWRSWGFVAPKGWALHLSPNHYESPEQNFVP